MKKNFNQILSLFTASIFLPATGSAALLAHYSFDTDFTDGSENSNNLTAAAGTDPVVTTTAANIAFGSGALDLLALDGPVGLRWKRS